MTGSSRQRRAALAAALALGGAACIADGPPGGGVCETSADCDQASGEICAEGICYGDPPDGARFAAVLAPPIDRADLALSELAELAIDDDGTIRGLDFAPSIEVRGRVVLACPTDGAEMPYPCGPLQSIDAQIVVERAGGFPGAPAWSRQITAIGGVRAGGTAFSVRLPRDPGATYQVTITPLVVEGSAAGAGTTPAELAPPRQLTLVADTDQVVEWYLGEPSELVTIHGCLTDGDDGAAYDGMQVTAFGRWVELGRLERASSLALTDGDGCFALLVPKKMVDVFDVLVKPAPGTTLPTLRLLDEAVPDPLEGQPAVHEITPPLRMPTTTTPAVFRLPVVALGSSGGTEPVAGADVRLETTFVLPAEPKAPERAVEVTYTAQAVTTDVDAEAPGEAELLLFPGTTATTRAYRLTIVPTAGTPHGAIWGAELEVGKAGTTLATQQVGRRVGLTGRAVTHDGAPLDGAPVELKLSTLYAWAVEDEATATAAASLPLASTATAADGSFFLWLDRELLAAPAIYDLEVKPATYAAPRWTFDALELPDGDTIELGKVVLPEASYARGPVRDPAGAAVAGAELRLFQLPDTALCDAARREPADCQPPAILRGAFAADAEGVVRPVLPDP